MHILSQFSEDRARFKISKQVSKIFRVLITVPTSRFTEYVVGEKEKDFLVGVFKDKAVVEELDLRSEGLEKSE